MPENRCRRAALVVCATALSAALVLGSAVASAQSDEERSGARSAATEGAKAFQERRWADAVDLFTRAESLVHAPPHLLFIARAQIELGHWVKARENLNKVTRERLAADAPPAFTQAMADAKAELDKLEAKLPSVTIQIQGGEGATVTVTEDGKPVPAALVGVPRPVDPGEHKYQATAPGLAAAETVTVAEGAKSSVVLALKPASGADPGAVPGGGTPAGGEGTPPGGDSSVSTSDLGGGSNGLRIASYAALGVGVIGLGVGTIFLISSGSKQDDADAKFDELGCGTPQGCPGKKQEVTALDDDASKASTLATVGFIVGGVGIAAGVTMFILSNKQEQSAQSPTPEVRPWIGIGSAGLSGTF